jgi:nucleotide-binding universal stress UspA family protein
MTTGPQPRSTTEMASIVVGVDGRDPAWEGLALARRLARFGGGRLTVVCAYPPPGYAHSSLLFNGMRSESDARDALRAARDRLSDPADADFVAISGPMPGQCLHDVASERRADVLVLGGAEHGTLGRVLGGSVLNAVLVEPPCPVAVSPRGHANASRRIARVGVAVDGSSEALAAIRWAHCLAMRHDEIHELRLLSAAGGKTSVAHARGASAVLAGMSAGGDRDGPDLKIRWTQAVGPVADRLADLSAGLDLLVIGTHGRRRLSRLLHGSVSADLARSAHCPVVAVPLMTNRD